MLLLLDEHLSTDDIAQRLYISEHTVRSHVKSCCASSASRRAARRSTGTPQLVTIAGPRGVLRPKSAVPPVGLDGAPLRCARLARLDEPGSVARCLVTPASGRQPSSSGSRRPASRVGPVAPHAATRTWPLRTPSSSGRPAPSSDRARGAPCASGSSACASTPADTSTSSGSNARTAGSTSCSKWARYSSSPHPAGRGTLTVVSSLVPGAARTRVERPLVQRREEHRVVAAEDRLRAVPVVDVDVDDRDARETELRLRVARRDRHVVHEAEAHRAVGERVVARRAHEREAARSTASRAIPAASVTASQLDSDAIVSEIEQRRRGRLLQPCRGTPSCAPARSARAAAPARLGRRSGGEQRDALCRSGWSPVGCSRASAALLRSSMPPPPGARPARRGPSRGPARRARPVRLRVPHRRQRRGRVERRDAPVEPQRVGLRRVAPRVEQRLQRAVLAQEVGRRLLAHAARAGILSDGSPRSAMKSGTCSGSTP